MAVPLETTISRTGVQQSDLVKFLENVRDLVNDIVTNLQATTLVTKPVLAVGSTAANVAHQAFVFSIGGVQYLKAANAVGVAPGNDVVTEDGFGAVALDIGANLTIDVIEAPANAAGYASAALALAALPAAASDHVRIGTVTASGSEAAFTFGTTDLDAANTTVAFADGDTQAALIDSTALTLNKG
jgi:hypothetical protein